MSMTKDDRETLLAMLSGLSARTLNEIGATGRTITTFMRQKNLKWEDILVQEVETADLLVNDSNEEQLLTKCMQRLEESPGLFTEFEREFIPDNVRKFKEYGYMLPKQRVILDRIIRKLQRLGVWEETKVGEPA